jgi:hypothetical protein
MNSMNSMNRRTRRYNVVALALVLCGWLIAAATHLHLQEHDAAVSDPAHCAYCFALSAGAAPAPELHLPTPIDAPLLVVSCDRATVEGLTDPSPYFSRGPPAA